MWPMTLMGLSELFQNQESPSENENKEDGRGRPTIPDNFLVGNRNAWAWLLQESWPEIGWSLLTIRKRGQGTINDIQIALTPLLEKNNGGLARSLLCKTEEIVASSEHIRKSRQAFSELNESVQRQTLEVNDATWKCNEIIPAFAQPSLVFPEGAIENECIERYVYLIRAQRKLRSLEEEAKHEAERLRAQEAAFYQMELLNYLTSKRYAVEPVSIANALAGLPTMGWRQSYDRCAKMQYETEPHLVCQLLQAMSEIWRNRPDTLLTDPTTFFKSGVLDLATKHSSARAYLMNNWHDFITAIDQCWNADKYFGEELPFVLTSAFIKNRSVPKTAAERLLASKDRLKV
jgi:hypothetical protein